MRYIDVSHYAQPDIKHVQECFPKATPKLQKHLGQAITHRRKQLIYWMTHHKALARMPEPIRSTSLGKITGSKTASKVDESGVSGGKQFNTLIAPTVEGSHPLTSVSGISTEATALALAPTQFSAIDAFDLDDARTDTTVASTSQGGDRAEIPPYPVDLNVDPEIPFECPYCYYIIKMRDIRQWRQVQLY